MTPARIRQLRAAAVVKISPHLDQCLDEIERLQALPYSGADVVGDKLRIYLEIPRAPITASGTLGSALGVTPEEKTIADHGTYCRTAWHLERFPGERRALRGKKVRVWSRELRGWWRPDSSGTTDVVEDAGIYTFEDAWERSHHYDPSVVYEVVR